MAVNFLNAAWDTLRTAKAAVIESILVLLGTDIVIRFVRERRIEMLSPEDWIMGAVNLGIGDMERVLGAPLRDLLIEAPSGIGAEGWGEEQVQNARTMIARMLGFAFLLPWGVSELKTVMQTVMGENAPKAVIEALEKLPEDVGINWALGTIMANLFETAVGQPIEEMIAYQTRPQRMQWQQIRYLMRQHALPDADARLRLSRAGWRDQDIDLLAMLDRQLIPVGDLQQAYMDGLIDEATTRQNIEAQGFNAEDANIIFEIWFSKAQTQAGDLYRTVARNGFSQGLIAEAQFRQILEQVNTPARSIDLEVQALKLQQQIGHVHLTVAEIQKLFQEGSLDEGQARQQLHNIGYDDESVTELFILWANTAAAGKTGLSVQKILQYQLSGVLTEQESFNKLIASGVRPQDASFLANHPGPAGTVYAHPLDAKTVVAAFQDGIITIDDARDKLDRLGVAPDERDLELAVAAMKLAKANKPKQASKNLDIAQIRDAYDLDLVTLTWADRQLINAGFSEHDANVITAEWFAKKNAKAPDGWSVLS